MAANARGGIIRAWGEQDVPALAALHEGAFAGQLGPTLGRRYLKAFFAWFVANPTAVGFVAQVERRLAGYVFGAPEGYGNQLNRELLPTILLSVATHPRAWRHRNFVGQFAPRLRVLFGAVSAAPSATAGSFCLTGIGVDPGHRSRGLARQLCLEFERSVDGRGFPRMTLDVYAENRAARALYESLGWRALEESGRVLLYEKRLTRATS